MEEARFDYLNHDFFEDDINRLYENLESTQTIMNVEIKQNSAEYDLKWFIFDIVS